MHTDETQMQQKLGGWKIILSMCFRLIWVYRWPAVA